MLLKILPPRRERGQGLGGEGSGPKENWPEHECSKRNKITIRRAKVADDGSRSHRDEGGRVEKRSLEAKRGWRALQGMQRS